MKKFNDYDEEKLKERRISFFDSRVSTLKLLNLDGGFMVAEREVLPWIAQYTEGNFYLGNHSIAFESEHDLFMFKLAFKR